MLPSTTINFPGRLQEVISLPPRPSLEFHILENQRGKNIPRWVAGVLVSLLSSCHLGLRAGEDLIFLQAFLTAITLSISQTTWSPNISGVKEGPANDVLSCFGAGSTIYDDEQKPVDGSSILKGLREKLDAGLGDGLIDRYRNLVTAAKDGWAKDEAKHKAVPLGAIIMGTGAKVRDHDLQYLRQICFEVGSDVPQFLTAVDNYKPGTPRNFGSSSCCKSNLLSFAGYGPRGSRHSTLTSQLLSTPQYENK
jgi:hypothetical protein